MNNGEAKDRRTLLKGIIAGSAIVGGSKALPEEWHKPLTDSVVLPSHARTTVDYSNGDWQPRDYSIEDEDVSEYIDGYSSGIAYDIDVEDSRDNPSGDYTYGDVSETNYEPDLPF